MTTSCDGTAFRKTPSRQWRAKKSANWCDGNARIAKDANLYRSKGVIAILVDDGLATGSTMRAAVKAVRQLRPSAVVVAVPVGARETCDELLGDCR